MNINDMVKVKLTSRGRQVLIYEQEKATGRRYLPPLDGWYRVTLWELMNTFGPYMFVGAPLLFEDNKVYLDGEL